MVRQEYPATSKIVEDLMASASKGVPALNPDFKLPGSNNDDAGEK